MTSEFFTLNLSDLETLISKNNCSCHFINPNKTRILMWKKMENNQTTYYLKIGIQKFSSQEQVDRNSEIYWRYWSYETKEIKAEKGVKKEVISQTELNHGKATSSSEQSESTSH